MDNSQIKSSIKQDLTDIIYSVNNVERLMDKLENDINPVDDYVINNYKSIKDKIENSPYFVAYRLILNHISKSWNDLELSPHSSTSKENSIRLLKESIAIHLALIEKISL